MSYCFFTFIDSSNETSTVSFNLEQMAADGTNVAAILADVAALRAAVEGVTNGNIKEEAVVFSRTRVTNVKPSDSSEREMKWVTRYQDDVTLKVHYLEIPNRDPDSMPLQPNADLVDLSTTTNPTNRDALIAAVNSNLVSPAGNACTLLDIERVGRTGL